MIRLAGHYGTSLTGVPVVGDSLRDLQAAAAVGARPLLVRTGNGERTASDLPADLQSVAVYDRLYCRSCLLDFFVAHLLGAAILQAGRRR